MIAVNEIKTQGFFLGLQDEHVSKIAEICHEEVLQAQQFIFKEGQEAKKLYILVQGTVAIQVPLRKYQYVIVNTVEDRGALFGCSALVDQKRYNAAAKCLGATRILAINAADLEVLFNDDPVLGLAFMRKVAALINQRLLSLRDRLISSIT